MRHTWRMPVSKIEAAYLESKVSLFQPDPRKLSHAPIRVYGLIYKLASAVAELAGHEADDDSTTIGFTLSELLLLREQVSMWTRVGDIPVGQHLCPEISRGIVSLFGRGEAVESSVQEPPLPIDFKDLLQDWQNDHEEDQHASAYQDAYQDAEPDDLASA